MKLSSRIQDFKNALDEADCADKAWSLFNRELHNFGFSGATYGLSSGLRNGSISDEVKYLSSYNQKFFEEYIANGMADFDYVVRHCAEKGRPSFWSSIGTSGDSSKVREFRDMASDYDMREGFVIPFHSKDSSIVSGIGMSFDAVKADKEDYFSKSEWRYINRVCQAFDTFMRRPLSLRQTYSLSLQEIECVRLVCHGKTNKEIAFSMGLSAKTVEHYLANAMKKLRCKNKHHLAAKSVLLRITMD